MGTSGDILRSELQGKAVLVTGGGSGIGAAISRAFGSVGARVAIHYYQSQSRQLQELDDEIRVAGGQTLLLQADLTVPRAGEQLIDQVVGRFGRLDVLVNNAGTMVARRRLEEIDEAFIDRVFNLNARSVVETCRAALPVFKEQGSGCIINVSSISARTGGSPGSSIYSGAKAFVGTFSRSLAKELAEYRIRVNALSPGTVETAFHERYSSPEKLEATRRTIPLQRLGQPEDCAGTALYLASEQLSGYITGQIIEINGGQLLA